MTPWLQLFGSLIRLGLAGALVAACWQSLPGVEARRALDAMPDYDYRAEASRLRGEQRFSEALIVLDAADEAADSEAALEADAQLRQQIETERDDWSRRLADAGQGALTGRGDSVESLVGAVVADLFVFGDIRDLVVEAGKTLRGEENDEVIVALAAAGIVLTVTPEVDFGAAIIKFARRAGALTEDMAIRLGRMARAAVAENNASPLVGAMEDAASLGRTAHPAGAMAVLRNVNGPEELKAVARFAERPEGRFALWVGGRPAIDLLQQGPDEAALLARAARKGAAGVEFAKRSTALLIRPHPLLGLLKGLYKGNVPGLAAILLEKNAVALFGVAIAWFVYEALLLLARAAFGRTLEPPAKRSQPTLEELGSYKTARRREPLI